MACPPSPGDQVLVLAQEGQSDSGVIVGRAWSDTTQGLEAPVGELWLTHASGSFLRLSNDGTIRTKGDVYVEGNLYVNGDIQDTNGSLSRLRTHYDQHTHQDSMGGRTSLPTPQD